MRNCATRAGGGAPRGRDSGKVHYNTRIPSTVLHTGRTCPPARLTGRRAGAAVPRANTLDLQCS